MVTTRVVSEDSTRLQAELLASRLAALWPQYAAAFALLQQRGGVEKLRAIAGER